MKAVVLAGGAGTRLRPLTNTIPKQVLPVVEVPMIERVLAYLGDHGVTEVVLSLGYLHDAFLTLFPEGRIGGVSLRYALEPEPLDTAGAVGFAARTAGIDETFLVVNGDVLTDLDIGALVRFHASRAAEGTIALTEVDEPSAFGMVPTDDDGKVLDFVEKPPPGSAADGLVNAGTYVLEPSVIERIATGRRVSIEREIFPAMAAGGALYGFPSKDYWTDTGTPVQYLQCQLDLLSGRRPHPPAPDALRMDGDVWRLGESVADGDVVGATMLGAASYVAGGALVDGGVVGAGARVLEGAEVHDSILLPGSVVRAGASVSRSLVGEGAVIGEDAIVESLSVVGGGAEVAANAHLVGARQPEG